jgi:predicted alpha/beta hydrolase
MPVFRNVHNWPIQRKLLLIILSTIAASLVLAMAGIVTFELTTYRKRLARELAGMGSFIGQTAHRHWLLTMRRRRRKYCLP